MTPGSDPAPVPARVLLPAPVAAGGDGSRGAVVWWQMSNGKLLHAAPGEVFVNRTPRAQDEVELDHLEQDALAVLAAVHWARRAA
jgi:hypothetical protein